MASGTSDLIVRLSLDTTQFEGSLSKFEGQMSKLQASCTNASTGMCSPQQLRSCEKEMNFQPGSRAVAIKAFPQLHPL